MKKIISVLVLFVMCFSQSLSFAQYSPTEKDITVTYNGKAIDFKDSKAQNIKGNTMVPMRAIFEIAGYDVSFDGEKREVLATKKDYSLKLTIDNLNATVEKNGKKENKKLDVAPTIVSGRTLVPVRFISESLGFIVNWNPNYKEVVIIDTKNWENRLKDSFVGNYIFENIKKYKAYNGQTYVKVDKEKIKGKVLEIDKLKKDKYNLQAVLDNEFNLYLKGEPIIEVTEYFFDKKTSNNLKNKYIMIPLKQLFATYLGIKIEEKGSLWTSVCDMLLNDEFIYSKTVEDIDFVVSLLENIKVSENSKFIGNRLQNVPSEAKVINLFDLVKN